MKASADRKTSVEWMIEPIRALEGSWDYCRTLSCESFDGVGAPLLSTAWNEIDAVLGGGLTRGGLHEWFGMASSLPEGEVHSDARCPDCWIPSLVPLVHLARRALRDPAHGSTVVWIGQRCFPCGSALIGSDGKESLLERSIFVDADRPSDRVWAIDLALRCRSIGVIVADGSGFDMATTRRIQLLAKTHHRLGFLARPPWEVHQLSAAQTRWLVRWPTADQPQEDEFEPLRPRWSVELLRCKGGQPDGSPRMWAVEWDRGQGALRVLAPLAGATSDAELVARQYRSLHA